MGVTLCHQVGHSQHAQWSLPHLSQAVLPQAVVLVLLRLGWTLLQRDSNISFPLLLCRGHQWLPSPSLVPTSCFFFLIWEWRSCYQEPFPHPPDIHSFLLVSLCDPRSFSFSCFSWQAHSSCLDEGWGWVLFPSWHQKGEDCLGTVGMCRHFWWSKWELQIRFRSIPHFQLWRILKWRLELNLGLRLEFLLWKGGRAKHHEYFGAGLSWTLKRKCKVDFLSVYLRARSCTTAELEVEGLFRATLLTWATHLHVLLVVAKRKTSSVVGNIIALQFASCLNKTSRPNY